MSESCEAFWQVPPAVGGWYLLLFLGLGLKIKNEELSIRSISGWFALLKPNGYLGRIHKTTNVSLANQLHRRCTMAPKGKTLGYLIIPDNSIFTNLPNDYECLIPKLLWGSDIFNINCHSSLTGTNPLGSQQFCERYHTASRANDMWCLNHFAYPGSLSHCSQEFCEGYRIAARHVKFGS